MIGIFYPIMLCTHIGNALLPVQSKNDGCETNCCLSPLKSSSSDRFLVHDIIVAVVFTAHCLTVVGVKGQGFYTQHAIPAPRTQIPSNVADGETMTSTTLLNKCGVYSG